MYLGEANHMARDVPFREAGRGISKQVLPLPLDGIEVRLPLGRMPRKPEGQLHVIVRGRAPLRRRAQAEVLRPQIFLEPATPLAQGARVVRAVVLDGLEREAAGGACLRGGDQRGRGGQARVRPHVAAHEIFGPGGQVASGNKFPQGGRLGTY
jgi:hypothetical protein